MSLCVFGCDCALHSSGEADAPRPMIVYRRAPHGESSQVFRGVRYALLFEALLWGAVVAWAALYRGIFHR
jgi:hypothetical protein